MLRKDLLTGDHAIVGSGSPPDPQDHGGLPEFGRGHSDKGVLMLVAALPLILGAVVLGYAGATVAADQMERCLTAFGCHSELGGEALSVSWTATFGMLVIGASLIFIAIKLRRSPIGSRSLSMVIVLSVLALTFVLTQSEHWYRCSQTDGLYDLWQGECRYRTLK